jgi:predicted amidohydrolase
MSSKRRIKPIEAAVISAALALVALAWARSFRGMESAGEPLPPRTFRVAAVQMYSRMGDLTYNRARMEKLARAAAERGADVIVFPEASVTGYVSKDFEIWTDPVARPDEGRSLQSYAETAGGKSVERFRRLAAELGVYIVIPFIEYDRAQKHYYNTLILAGPGGKVRGHYRKLNPWPRAEATWATDGDRGLCAVKTEFGRLGLLICYDIHTVADRLAKQGVDTLLYSIAWVDHKPQMWFDERLPGIADRLQVNIVASNWTFPRKSPLQEKGYGYSRVISADGEVLARASAALSEEIVFADLPVHGEDGTTDGHR